MNPLVCDNSGSSSTSSCPDCEKGIFYERALPTWIGRQSPNFYEGLFFALYTFSRPSRALIRAPKGKIRVLVRITYSDTTTWLPCGNPDFQRCKVGPPLYTDFTPRLARRSALLVSPQTARPRFALARLAGSWWAEPCPASQAPPCQAMRSLSADSTDNQLDVLHRNLRCGQPDDVPTAQPRVKVFYAIADESHPSIVTAAAATKNAALDFEKQAAGKMREIRAPASLGMKHELAFQSRAARCAQ